MTNINCAWVAGLLEGEGSFIISRRKSTNGSTYPTFSVKCGMCDKDALEKLMKLSEMGNVTGPHLNKKNPRAKPVWYWSTNRRECVRALCLAILPWMGSRRRIRIEQVLMTLDNSGQTVWQHGSRQGYDKHKCRCSGCRAAHAKHHRERRMRKKYAHMF